MGFPLECCDGDGTRETRTMPLRDHQKCDNRPIRLDKIPSLARKGRTKLVKQYRALRA